MRRFYDPLGRNEDVFIGEGINLGCLIFGVFYMLYKGLFKWAVIYGLAALILSPFMGMLAPVVVWTVGALKVNEFIAEQYRKKGYKEYDEEEMQEQLKNNNNS